MIRKGSALPEGGDPAYPDVRIPSPPPDLDRGKVPYRNFTVLAPDPHRFDGDKGRGWVRAVGQLGHALIV